MAKRIEKTVLFLGTANYTRCRCTEVLFNSVAAKMGLPCKASSRGLALERGDKKTGPMSVVTIKALEKKGLRGVTEFTRMPVQATLADFENAAFIVALKQAEHLPLLQERFSIWLDKVEYWNVDDAPGMLALLEREVMGLTARLITGGKREEPSPEQDTPKGDAPKAKKESTKSGAVVRVGRETKGRRGKGVTIVSDVPLDEVGLLELATKLKQRCGTGGTVKDGRIEIQGDQRDRLTTELESLGYRVKRVGG